VCGEDPLLGIDETLPMVPVVEFMQRHRRPDCAFRPHGGDAGENARGFGELGDVTLIVATAALAASASSRRAPWRDVPSPYDRGLAAA